MGEMNYCGDVCLQEHMYANLLVYLQQTGLKNWYSLFTANTSITLVITT